MTPSGTNSNVAALWGSGCALLIPVLVLSTPPQLCTSMWNFLQYLRRLSVNWVNTSEQSFWDQSSILQVGFSCKNQNNQNQHHGMLWELTDVAEQLGTWSAGCSQHGCHSFVRQCSPCYMFQIQLPSPAGTLSSGGTDTWEDLSVLTSQSDF